MTTKPKAVKSKKPVSDAPPLFDRVRDILESARSNIARTVNTTQVMANWLVGREIVEEERAIAAAKPDDAADYFFKSGRGISHEVVEAISKVPKGRGDRPIQPVVIDNISISQAP